MPRYLILARSGVTANALGAWLSLWGETCLDEKDPRRIVWDRPARQQSAVASYETLVRRIEVAARDGDNHVPLNQVVALVDAVRPSGLSAVAESGSWENLIAMLILTFPEVRWMFGIAVFRDGSEKGVKTCWERTIAPDHSLVALLIHGQRDTLFDPTGLREWVRALTIAGLDTAGDDLQLAARKMLAAAIDEEKTYAYLHGYTAYRFGCRVDVVTSWQLMKERFNEEGAKVDPHGYWLLLEDMSLNFPDRENGKHLLHLANSYGENGSERGRAYYCNRLNSTDAQIEESKYRILVTTGQTRPGDNAFIENRNYLRGKATGIGKVVFKPVSGMFDLWEKVGLYRKQTGSCRLGNAPDFCWPPAPPGQANKNPGGHGAPGKLMLVAEMLIRRAEALLGNVKSVDAAVQGAVLATDALELTGGRTPTTAVEALSLKHQFEVMAECQFSGVEYHLRIAPRITEIALELDAICLWFGKNHQRESARLNARMHILNRLVSILRSHNQFDEEQQCTRRIRHLHNTLWMGQRPSRRLLWPVLRYLELLLSSFSVFVQVLVAWLLVIGVLFWQTGPETGTILCGLQDSVSAFFSMGPPITPSPECTLPSQSWAFSLVASLAVFSGFIHLGVFVSHLYSITMRR